MPEIEARPERSTQPEWFVLDGPDYQGPISGERLHELLRGSTVTSDSLFWRAGMNDWLPAEDIEELQAYAGLLAPSGSRSWRNPPSEEPASAAKPPLEIADVGPPVPEPVREEEPAGANVGEAAWSKFVEQAGVKRRLEEHRDSLAVLPVARATFAELKAVVDSLPVEELRKTATVLNTPREPSRPKIHWGEVALAAAAIALATAAATVTFVVPKMISSKPSIGRFDDLSPEDRRDLAGASAGDFNKNGARLAVAVSQTDYFAPVFFIAANVPDGTALNVQIDGVPESLVDRFKVSVRSQVVIKDGMAKTPAFRQDDGTPYNMGQYWVSVTCPSCAAGEGESHATKNTMPFARKGFFLGQEVAAGDYERALKAYHERLRASAADELAELKQMAESVGNQLNETDSTFQAEFMNNLPVASRAARWTAYHSRWSDFQEQLGAVFARWTPEALDGAYYHSGLFAQLKKIGDRTSAVHDAQVAYMTAGVRDPVKRDNINRETAQAKALLLALQNRIRRTSELPPANGMPGRVTEQ